MSEHSFIGTRKHPKKESRKPPAYVADTLGPALFSTPDIIRRVGSSSEGKIVDNIGIPTTPTSSATIVSTSSTVPASAVTSLNTSGTGSDTTQNTASSLSNKKAGSSISQQSIHPESRLGLDEGNNMTTENENEKTEDKPPLSEELQPSLDSGMFYVLYRRNLCCCAFNASLISLQIFLKKLFIIFI